MTEPIYRLRSLGWEVCKNPDYMKAPTIDGGWYMVSIKGTAHGPNGLDRREEDGDFESAKAICEAHHRERIMVALYEVTDV